LRVSVKDVVDELPLKRSASNWGTDARVGS